VSSRLVFFLACGWILAQLCPVKFVFFLLGSIMGIILLYCLLMVGRSLRYFCWSVLLFSRPGIKFPIWLKRLYSARWRLMGAGAFVVNPGLRIYLSGRHRAGLPDGFFVK